jgi:CubicO group peptidase (beta-lactamase class C family)
VGAGGAVPPSTGDRELALELARLAGHRCRRVAAATVHLDAADPVRMAFIRADARTLFEVGSITKAMTGMLLADAIERTELTMTSTVGQLAPSLMGSAVATVTVQELCTHTSGLPRLPNNPRTVVRVAQFGLLGLDPYRGITASQVVAIAGRQKLRHRGRPAYSNLGAALLGQLLAERAGADFGVLLQQRIFTPVGMHGAGVATMQQKAAPGWSDAGLPRQPWVLDGYAPAGGVIATIGDLASLAVALLGQTAPGCLSTAAIPGVLSTRPDRRSGMFWIIDPLPAGGSITWHNGATGGYSSFFALFTDARQAVVVLANISRAGDQERIALGLVSSGDGSLRKMRRK